MLPYYDPVKHIVLGFMHNWLEGVLSDHLRIFWGIGRDQGHEKQVKEIEKDEQWETTDVDESADELQDILQDSADFGDEKFLQALNPLIFQDIEHGLMLLQAIQNLLQHQLLVFLIIHLTWKMI